MKKSAKYLCVVLCFLLLPKIQKAQIQTCTDIEPNNNINTATNLFGHNLFTSPDSKSVLSKITYDDQDWYILGMEYTGTLTISLTTLPADFDIELYPMNGTASQAIGKSYNSGTVSEQIVYDYTIPQSTALYIKVYGYKLAYNNANCYTLSVSWKPTCPLSNTTPILKSPGYSSGPGEEVTSLTPKLTWNSVPDATSYDVFMTDLTTGQLILENNCATTSTQYTVPNGLLSFGKNYRWNIQANIDCGSCESKYSSRLYFYTSGGCSPPSIQAKDITFPNIQSEQLTVSWANGNGSGRLVKINTSNTFSDPQNGTTYIASSTYGGFGEQVIYNGTSGNSVIVTGLTQATTYYFKIYETNCTSGSVVYNTSTAALNPNSVTTLGNCVVPTITTQPKSGEWCQNQTPVISVYATGSNLHYQWEIKNAGDYIEMSGENNYSLSTTIAGTYRCILSNTCGNIPSADATVTTSSCSGPIANFYANPTIISAGQTVSFTDQSLNAAGASRSWKFERQQANGSTSSYSQSTLLNPTITFNFPGCYQVTLKVSDNSQSNTLSIPCYITVTPNLNTGVNQSVAIAYDYPVGYCGDPVNTATGAFVFSMKDISLFSFGKELAIDRRYVSSNTDIGYFGKGWSFLFDTKLVTTNQYQWEVHHSDGHVSYHIPYSGGETRSLYPGMLDTLYYTGSPGGYSYTYREHSGIEWHFLSSGKLDKIVDRNGNAIQCLYSGSSLSGITTPSGRNFVITTNSNKRITQITDPSGRTVFYYYSGTSNEQLDSVKVEKSTTSFKYNAIGLTEVYDPNGNRVVKVAYNSSTNKVFRQYDVFDNPTNFEFPTSSQTIVTDANLQKKKFTYDNSLRLIISENELAYKRRFTYTANSQIASYIDEKNDTTAFAYDNANNIIKIIDPKKFSDSFVYDAHNKLLYSKDATGNELHVFYDDNGNPITTLLPNNGEINSNFDNQGLDTLIVDAKGNQIRKEYHQNGDLYKIKTTAGITSYGYDVIGRIIAITNPLGYTDSIAYNYFDQIIKATDPLGFAEHFEYDKNGNLITHIDKEGSKTTYEYDIKDRLKTILEPYNHITKFEYDILDRLVKRTDANGNIKNFVYDATGQLITIEDAALGVLYTYLYDQVGNKVASINHDNKTNRVVFDERNLPIALINGINDTIKFEYNGKRELIKVTDEEGKNTFYDYNSLGQRNKITDANGGIVRVAYDLNGNIDTLNDAKGNIRTWKYDAANRLISYNDGFGDYAYQYDSAGRLTIYSDRASHNLSYLYSPNDQLLTVKNKDEQLQWFTYTPNGLMKTASTSAGTSIYNYDLLGRIVAKVGQFNDSIRYSYDSAGNVLSVTTNGKKQTKYEYNSINASTKVIDWNNHNYILHRSTNGILDSITYPNQSKTKLLYDDAYHITSWKNCSSGISPPFHENYVTRNKNGFIVRDTGIKVSIPHFKPLSASSTYDIDDRGINYGAYSFDHDGNGNRIKTQSDTDSSTYSYTPENNLINYQHNGVQTLMMYDALNQRVKKTGNTLGINYTIDNSLTSNPLILSETNSINNSITTNVYTPEGVLLSRDSSGNWRYYHYDIYGNTIALSTDSGSLTDTYAYGAFGDSYNHSGYATQPYTYLGMYGVQQEDSVVYYVWARFYDAQTGRFLSKDPYPFSFDATQEINRYVYGLNNPVSYVDVTGLKAINNTSEYSPYQQTFISAPHISLIDFVPIVGGAKDVYLGIKNGNLSLVGVGWASILLDVFTAGEGSVAKGAFKSIAKVEQYTLRAAEDGFYPVFKRGFTNPQELIWLKKDDVWKFGTTKNPLTRYKQTYLDNIGEYGVKYSSEFSGTLQEALQLEKMKILNSKGQNGFLPAGNKIIK